MKKLSFMLGAAIFTVMSVAVFVVTHYEAEAQESTQVNLVISGNNTLTIGQSGAFNFDSIAVPTSTQVQEKQFTGTEYFWLEDYKGSNSGYTTTLSITDLSGANTSAVISGENVKIKTIGTGVTLITGSLNDRVQVSSGIADTYVDFRTAPVTFIYREAGDNNGLLGKYAVRPWLQLTVPAFQAADTYQGIITYTLTDHSL